MGLHSSPSPPGRPTDLSTPSRQTAAPRPAHRQAHDRGRPTRGRLPTHQRENTLVRLFRPDHAAASSHQQPLDISNSPMTSQHYEPRSPPRAATAATVQETNRLLLANQAIMLNALNDYREASDDTAAIADDYRALTERHSSIAGRYRSSADSFAQALGNYRDIVGQAPDAGRPQFSRRHRPTPGERRRTRVARSTAERVRSVVMAEPHAAPRATTTCEPHERAGGGFHETPRPASAHPGWSN